MISMRVSLITVASSVLRDVLSIGAVKKFLMKMEQKPRWEDAVFGSVAYVAKSISSGGVL